jgi:putative ABC transport system substrate-binding protein
MCKFRFIKLFLTVVTAAVILCSSPVHAADIVSLQSVRITPYDEAFQGLRKTCGCSVKQLVMSELKGENVLRKVWKERPHVIVAIGVGALNKVMAVHDIPIVYLMVLDAQAKVSGQDNVAGINMSVEPSRQLQIIGHALPEVRNIGILYHPDHTGRFVLRAAMEARSSDLRITAGEVRKPADITAQLKSMTGKIDALWMVPDVAVITPETVEILFLYSIEHKVPVITFSSKYLEKGALMSLDVDAYDMGRQAAEMAAMVRSGRDINTIENQKAEKINITVNMRTARKLGVRMSDEILKKAKFLNGE